MISTTNFAIKHGFNARMRLARRDGLLRGIDSVAIRGRADMNGHTALGKSVEFDPNVWSGRALQEDFLEVGGCAVLHQCIRPLRHRADEAAT